jgi:group I intron endonuclease
MYQVYKITCSSNGKVYIGYTSKGYLARFESHISNARWKRKTALYDSIRLYGPEAFSVELLIECESHADACAHEINLIKELNSLIPFGYNMTKGGDGVPLTDAQRAAASAKKRGRFTEKQRIAADRRIGIKASDETRKKLSDMRKGKKQSPEWIRKRTESMMLTRALNKAEKVQVAL